MPRKRGESVQEDQYKDHLMVDSATESCFQPDGLEQKHKNFSFFSIPGLFVGFNIKSVPDADSTKSPTSPLDYSIFKTLGDPFKSPSSCPDGPQKIWDSSKVGLGIVDSLNDETKKSGEVFGSSDSKNILIGSQMRINIPSSRRGSHGSINSSAAAKSLPENYFISPNAQINTTLDLGSSEIAALRAEETQLEPKPLGKIQSCLSDPSNSLSYLTGLAYCNPNSSSDDFWSDEKTKSGSPLIVGDPNLDNFLDVKPNLLSVTVGPSHGLMETYSESEIELSEYYTCVTSHGPNPRTTHIFGDCVLGCYPNELINRGKKGIEMPTSANRSGHSVTYPSDGFLKYCYFCRKNLEGKDIYIYRGEMSFCSSSCRSEEILIEEEMEKLANNSSNNSPKLTSSEGMFLPGLVVFT